MITVLRLGHRKKRDVRLTTHVGLIARAFGASEIIISGEKDASVLKTLKQVTKRWGGPFKVRYEKNHRAAIRKFRGTRVHLSMYGLPIQNKIAGVRRAAKRKNLLIVVGGEKVPGEVYKLVDFNISVTQQPHSEAAALAIFLHEFLKGRELSKKFKAAKLRIVPQEKGKKVLMRRK